MNELGPVVQHLGSFLQTSAGRARMIVVALLCALAVFCFGTGAVTFVSTLLIDGYGPGEQAAALFFWSALGIPFLGFAIIFVVLLNRTTATIHTHGLFLRQTFFSTNHVLWRDVAHVEAPKAYGRWVSCHIALWSGRSILADRLSLRSKEGPDGTIVPHPGVQTVMRHLGAWRRAHGRAAQ
jgi:hypothetical protein